MAHMTAVAAPPLVLMPPLVRWTHYSLFVAAYRVEGLPNMDEYSSTDPFIAMKMHGQSALKSSVKNNTLNPVFNELLRMPLKLPLLNDTLTLRLADYDQGGYDDLIADVHFSLNEVVRAGTVEPHWRCLYGVYNTKGMKQVRTKLGQADLETAYKGRLLVALSVQEVEKPLSAKSKTIGPCSDPQQERYVLRFDLYQVSQLCARCAPDNTQLQLELQCGGLTLTSSVVLAEEGRATWHEMFPEHAPLLPSRLAQVRGTRTNRKPLRAVMPCPGRARMLGAQPCRRASRAVPRPLPQPELHGPGLANAEPSGVHPPQLRRGQGLQPPADVEYVAPRPAFSASLGRPGLHPGVRRPPPLHRRASLDGTAPAVCSTASTSERHLNSLTRRESRSPCPRFVILSCAPTCTRRGLQSPPAPSLCSPAAEQADPPLPVYPPPPPRNSLVLLQARHLPAMDADGLCNAYVVVTCAGHAGHTRNDHSIVPSCDPQWYETVTIELPLPQPVPLNTEILVRVYDKDSEEEGLEVGGDQLVGKCTLPLLKVGKVMPQTPIWMPLWLHDPKDADDHQGDILCSFQLLPVEETKKLAGNDIRPPTRDCEVEVNVVGLREVLPVDNVPLGKLFVEVDLGDRSSESKVQRTVASNRPTPASPNFLSTLTIPVKLPDSALFCPALNVRVFDAEPQKAPTSASAAPPSDGDALLAEHCVGQLSIPLAPYCAWLGSEVCVPNNRPRIPAFKISDELSESSSDEEQQQDPLYATLRTHIAPAMADANCSLEPEFSFDTPTALQLKASRWKGRLRSGVRTVPRTAAAKPFGLEAAAEGVEELEHKPLDAELEHVIEFPPFDEWDVLRQTREGRRGSRKVGKFKARLRVIETTRKNEAGPQISLPELFEQSVFITRLYVTRGIKLEPKDENGDHAPPPGCGHA